MTLDRRLLKHATRHTTSFTFSVSLGLVASLAIIFQAKFLSTLIDDVFLGDQLLSTVKPLLFLFLISAAIRAGSTWGSQAFASNIGRRIKSELRCKLNSTFIQLGPAYLRTQRSGELENTFVNGVDQLNAYFSEYLPQVLFAVFIPILILIFVFPLDLLSGIIFLVTAPLIPLFMILIGDMARKMTRRQWKATSRLSSHFLDVLQGLTTLKILGQSKNQIKTIRTISDTYRKTTIKVLRIAFLSALVLEIIATISTAIIAVEIGLRLLYGKMGFQESLFILLLAPEFYQPLRQLGPRFHAAIEGVTAAQVIFDILHEKPQIHPGKRTVADPIQTIRFDRTSYVYAGHQTPAVEHISFNWNRGQKLALVGASGSGKTTLTYLLFRFMDPTQGHIFIDDNSLTELDVDAWRRNLSWVPQHPYLFHTTIRENIRLAQPSASDDQIIHAAQLAHLHDYITLLPNGYETVIGEQGARLSGGQAQRLSIARAFLKDTPFLILDEPTSNLDPATEALVSESIARLQADRSVLTIAHRLQTVKQADQIMVLSRGELVETGDHTQLLAQQGEYYRFIRANGGAA